MNNQFIKLGDEIEDVTAKVRGIATGRVKYLDGAKSWLMQPPYNSDGSRIPIVEVQDSYAKKVGDGVYIKPEPPMGFHARKAQG